MFALGRSVAVLLLLCLKLCDGFVPNANRVRAKRQLVNTCLVSNAVNFQCLKTYAQPRHSICYPYGIPQSCYINVEMQVTEGCTRTRQMCCNGFFNNINGCFGSFPGSLQGLETACSGHVRELSAPYGTVTSPNYPGTYPGNSNCRWMVITPPGGTTTIRVTSLNLHVPRQQCTTCQYGCPDAKLIIQDGDRKWSLCGSTLPSTSFTSRRASVLITFFVNAYSNFPAFPPIGFNLTYIITSPTTTPIPTTTVMTSPTMTSPTTTPLTSPTSTYVTSPALVGACGGSELKLAGPSGNVTSPGYPGLYPSNVNCRWMIVASPSSFVTVTVTDLQMEEASNLCNGVECRSVCHNDELVIEDTDQKWRLCGSTLPSSSFTARGKLVFLSFSTNGLKNYRGFRISYTVSVLPSGPTPPDVINTPVTSSTPPETHQATTTTYVPEVTTTEEAPVGLNRSFVFCLGDRVHVDCEPFCSLSCVRGVVTSPTCFARSCRPSCACPEDRPISYGTQCLTSEQCKSNLPAPCPGGMSHSQCKTCNRFCPGFGDPSKANQCGIIPGKCVSGCSCPRYFPYWHHDTCIPFALCPPPRPECTGGRYYTLCVGCTQACPKYGEQGGTLQCVNDPSSCVAGCACPGNLPVWHDGACIARNRCPAPKPKTVTCGKQYYKPKVKIVGGQWANQGSWPWIVQLIKGIFGRERHQCGGTLICANWVLTAAHCFLVEGGGSTETNTYIFRVNIGKHKRENDGDRPIVSQVIEAFYLHPQYDTISQANDIALIKLKTPVNMTKAIRPACVPNYIRPIFKGIPWGPLTGTRCYVIGWGLTENTGPNNTYLKQASLTIRPTSECYLHYVHFKPENMLCVGGQRKVDTCQGDSGGPLMCRHGLGVNATWYVDGVTSYGLKCGEVGYPGVYSRVTSYAKWIRQVTSGSADCRSSDQEWPEH